MVRRGGNFLIPAVAAATFVVVYNAAPAPRVELAAASTPPIVAPKEGRAVALASRPRAEEVDLLDAEWERRGSATGGEQQGSAAFVFYRNCRAAWAAGAAPIYQGQPGYRPQLDGDSDGIACEPYRGR